MTNNAGLSLPLSSGDGGVLRDEKLMPAEYILELEIISRCCEVGVKQDKANKVREMGDREGYIRIVRRLGDAR